MTCGPAEPRRGQQRRPARWRRGILLASLALVTACTTAVRVCSPCSGPATLDPLGLLKPSDDGDTVKTCIQARCHTQSIVVITGDLSNIGIWGAKNGTTIRDFKVIVMRGKQVIRTAHAVIPIHVPPVSSSSDCGCHGVTIHYDAATGNLYGIPH